MFVSYQIYIAFLLTLQRCLLLSGQSDYRLAPDYEDVEDDNYEGSGMEMGGSGLTSSFFEELEPSVVLFTELLLVSSTRSASSRLSSSPPNPSAFSRTSTTSPPLLTSTSTPPPLSSTSTPASLPLSSAVRIPLATTSLPLSSAVRTPLATTPLPFSSTSLPLATTSLPLSSAVTTSLPLSSTSLPLSSAVTTSLPLSSAMITPPSITSLPLATPTTTPLPTMSPPPEQYPTIYLTFEPLTLNSSNTTEIESEINAEIIDNLVELGIREEQINSVTVTVIVLSDQRIRATGSQTSYTITVQIALFTLQQAEEEILKMQVETGNFTITVSGVSLTATGVNISRPGPTTLSSTAHPTSLSPTATMTTTGTSYNLMILFYMIVVAAAICVILILLCALLVVCVLCCYRARRKRRTLVYTLEKFEFVEQPTWRSAYYPAPTTDSPFPLRPLSSVINNPMANSTFNIVHEL